MHFELCIVCVCVWVEWVVGGLRYLVLMMPVAAATAAATTAATVAEVFPGKAFAMFCFMFYECVRACVCAPVCGSSHFIVDSLNFSCPFPPQPRPSPLPLRFVLVMRHVRVSHLMLLLIKLSLASGRVFFCFFFFVFFCLSVYAC